MFGMRYWAIAPVLVFAAGTVTAQAADVTYQELPELQSYIFGQITTGIDVTDGTVPEGVISYGPAQDFTLPTVHIGGKVALRSDATPFGVQFDLHYNGMDTGWWDPGLPGSTASASDLNATGHLTYTSLDRMVKWGGFVEYQQLDVSSSQPNLNGGDDLEALLFGGEVIYTPREQTTLYGRVAYIDIDGKADDGTGGLYSVLGSGQSGWHIGGGAREKLSPEWSVQGDVNFTEIDFTNCGFTGGCPGAPNPDGEMSVMDVRGQVNYHFVDAPIILSGQAGYINYNVNKFCFGGVCGGAPIEQFDVDAFTGRIRLTVELGAAPAAADGTLFTNYSLPTGVN